LTLRRRESHEIQKIAGGLKALTVETRKIKGNLLVLANDKVSKRKRK
jgi:hypothetical protein